MADITAKNLTREQDIPSVEEYKSHNGTLAGILTDDTIKDYLFNSVNLVDDLLSGTLTDIGGFSGVEAHLGEVSLGRLKRLVIEVAGRALNFYEGSIEYSMTDQEGSNESTAKSFAAKIFSNQNEMITPNLKTLANKTGIYNFVTNGLIPFASAGNYVNNNELDEELAKKINSFGGSIELDDKYFKVVDGKIQVITDNLPANLKFNDGSEVSTQETKAETLIGRLPIEKSTKGTTIFVEYGTNKFTIECDAETGICDFDGLKFETFKLSKILWDITGDAAFETVFLDPTDGVVKESNGIAIHKVENAEVAETASASDIIAQNSITLNGVKITSWPTIPDITNKLDIEGTSGKSKIYHNATFLNVEQTKEDGTVENWLFESDAEPDSVIRNKNLAPINQALPEKINRFGDTMSGVLYGAGNNEPTSYQNRSQIASMILQATPTNARETITNQDNNITSQLAKRTEIFTLNPTFDTTLAYLTIGDKDNYLSPGADKFSTNTANDLASFNILIGGVQMDGVTGITNSYIKRTFTQLKEQWDIEQSATINYYVYRADDTIEKSFTITLDGIVVDGKLNLGETAYLVVTPYNTQGKPGTPTFNGSVYLNDTSTTLDLQNVRIYLEKSQYVNYDAVSSLVPTFNDGVIVADVNWNDKQDSKVIINSNNSFNTDLFGRVIRNSYGGPDAGYGRVYEYGIEIIDPTNQERVRLFVLIQEEYGSNARKRSIRAEAYDETNAEVPVEVSSSKDLTTKSYVDSKLTKMGIKLGMSIKEMKEILGGEIYGESNTD